MLGNTGLEFAKLEFLDSTMGETDEYDLQYNLH